MKHFNSVDLRNIAKVINCTDPTAAQDVVTRQYLDNTLGSVSPALGAWTSFTTTWSGTLGNGTNSCSYMRVGRTVFYRIRIIWGSTTSHAAATQTFTLPVAPSGAYTQAHAIGIASALESGVGQLHGMATMTSTASTIDVQVGGGSSKWSNTNPMTWGTNDIASIIGTYEAAADVGGLGAWPYPTESVWMALPGIQIVGAGTMPLYFPYAVDIQDFHLSTLTNATITLDVNRSGTTMFVTQGNRPALSASQTDATSVPDAASNNQVSTSQYLTVDVDVATSSPADLMLRCDYKRV